MKTKISIIIICIIFLLTSCSGSRYLIEIPELQPEPRKIENVKIALVLGGGGAKGIVHVGVLEVLEKYNIPVDLIVGTSAGSIVGSMYADSKDYKSVYNSIMSSKKWDFLDISITDAFGFFSGLKGPIQGHYLQDFIIKNVSVDNIEDLKIPFVAVATEMRSGTPYRFSSGPVALGVLASSSIPMVFSPVVAYDQIFVDGGVLEPVPISTAKSYNPKMIIAVDVTSSGKDYPVYNMFDILYKSLSLNYYQVSHSQSKEADILIHPDLSNIGTFDDSDNFKLYTLGKLKALEKIPDILLKMKECGIEKENN
jgi:NTE family protein